MVGKKPILNFPRSRYGQGSVVVTASDLELRRCPACRGTGKLNLSDLRAFTKHSELDWRCRLCDGVGQIATTEATYADLQDYYK